MLAYHISNLMSYGERLQDQQSLLAHYTPGFPICPCGLVCSFNCQAYPLLPPDSRPASLPALRWHPLEYTSGNLSSVILIRYPYHFNCFSSTLTVVCCHCHSGFFIPHPIQYCHPAIAPLVIHFLCSHPSTYILLHRPHFSTICNTALDYCLKYQSLRPDLKAMCYHKRGYNFHIINLLLALFWNV